MSSTLCDRTDASAAAAVFVETVAASNAAAARMMNRTEMEYDMMRRPDTKRALFRL
jgi:hypothetical protein